MIVLESKDLSLKVHFYQHNHAKADRQGMCAFVNDLTHHIAKQRFKTALDDLDVWPFAKNTLPQELSKSFIFFIMIIVLGAHKIYKDK